MQHYLRYLVFGSLIFGALIFIKCDKKDYNKGFYESKNANEDLNAVKKREVIIEDDSYQIGDLEPFFTVSSDTTFLFFDKMKKEFLYVDNEGNILSVIGGAGRGPKEFISVNHFTLDEKSNLVAFDGAQSMIKIISPNRELIHTFSLEFKEGFFPVGHSIYAREGKIYMGILNTRFINQSWKCRLIAVYNYSGEYIGTIGKFDPFLKTSKVMANRPFFDIDFVRQKIIAVNQSSYRLQVLHQEDGERISYFGRQSEPFKISEEPTTPSMPITKIQELGTKMSYSNGAYFTDKYYLHFFMNLTEEWYQTTELSYRKYFLGIYDKESQNLLNTIRLPYSLGAVQNNQLYLVENSNPEQYTIGVYEIE